MTSIQVTTQFTDELYPSIEEAELAIAGFAGAAHYKPLSPEQRVLIEKGEAVSRVFGNLTVYVRARK